MHFQFVEHAFPTSELLHAGAKAKEPVHPLVWKPGDQSSEDQTRRCKQSSRAVTSQSSSTSTEKLANYRTTDEEDLDPAYEPCKAPALLDADSTVEAEEKAIQKATRNGNQEKRWRPTAETSTIARTIRPAVGALHSNTLHLASREVVDNMFDTQINIIWPVAPAPYDPHSRLSLLCANELLLHVYATSSAVHRDVLQGTRRWSAKAEILSHACSAVSLLNHLLTHLTDASIEIALLSMLLIHVSPLDWNGCEPSKSQCLFQPYPNPVSHIDVWGKLLMREDRLVTGMRAMKVLVARRGGLEKLYFGGLAMQAAIGDLMVASRSCSPPSFPCYWHQSCVLDPGASHAFHSSNLPPILKATLFRLRQTDRLIEKRMAEPELIHRDHSDILNRRCCIQHEVLSILPYYQLSQDEKMFYSGDEYEAHRLTALLHSTFVIFGMPPDTGWHLTPLQQLRSILERGALEMTRSSQGFLIWMTTIAGMAAFYTEHREFYLNALQRALTKSEIWDWESFREILTGFCWSDSACSAGTDVLWASLKVRSATGFHDE